MKTMAVQTATDGLEYHERADVDLVSSAKAGDNLAMTLIFGVMDVVNFAHGEFLLK
jgi:hypothetical protein